MVWTADQVYNYGLSLIDQFHPEYSEELDGGTGPNFYDCSGWVQALTTAGGIEMTRTTVSEFEQSNLIHSDAPQFMCLGWLQVPGDAGSVPGIPDHVFFWLNETTCLEAPHSGEPVGVYEIPPNTPEEYLICYGIVPYAASASPPPAPPAPPEDFMPVSPLVSYRTGQTDIFQVNANSLVHKYAQPGDQLRSEVVAGPLGGVVGEAPVQSFPDQTPGISQEPPTGPGTVSVTVEDVDGHVHLFQQGFLTNGTGGPWEHSIFP